MSLAFWITALGRLLPAARRDWSRAMLAELDAIPNSTARRRFGAGCVRALILHNLLVRFHAWTAQPAGLALAVIIGLAIAALDHASDTRRAMWMALVGSSGLFAWWRPASAWRWGLMLAIGIPFVAAVRAGGPYAFDRGDAMFGIPPAVLVATLVGHVRRRLKSALLAILAVNVAAGGREAMAQSAPARHALTSPDVEAFADSAFAEYLQRSPQPSLAFVVVKDGAILFARGYGTEDPEGTRAVDPDATVFWMASLSKLITAHAVMREVERGRITLNASAARYLGWALPSRNGWPAITVENLLTHTAGVDEPFMQGAVDDSAQLVPLRDYLEHIHWRAGARPGDLLRYSNHGMALAGEIVERTGAMPFADYVERDIFAPLGMGHSTFRQPIPADLARRIATAGTAEAVDYVLPTPAGAMVGTASDMGRFLIAQLDTAGPHAAALRAMHATHWRAHPSVPGVGFGWFETQLGGVQALYHTGARHHFSVAWIAPSRKTGLFLVHSMRQGGPFQNLRTDVLRSFAERYFDPDVSRGTPATVSRHVDGVYRPALLGTTTVEAAGNLFLDTPVRLSADGILTMQAPGGLGTITAHSVGDAVYEVWEGPHRGLRLGFVGDGDDPRIAMGGTLLDPVIFTRLAWWEGGVLHTILLLAACLAIVLGASTHEVRRIFRSRRGAVGARDPVWAIAGVTGMTLVLATLAFVTTIVTTPEVGAADHMRAGIIIVLLFLSIAAVLCATVPVVVAITWRRRVVNSWGRISPILLSLASAVAAVLLWCYRLVGFNL